MIRTLVLIWFRPPGKFTVLMTAEVAWISGEVPPLSKQCRCRLLRNILPAVLAPVKAHTRRIPDSIKLAGMEAQLILQMADLRSFFV
jgi:hypothetical protein